MTVTVDSKPEILKGKMLPRFAQAGSRGGPLRPTGSSTVPTNVRPYRFSSGSLRIVVSLDVYLVAVLNRRHATSAVMPVYLKSSSFDLSSTLAGRPDVHSGNDDCCSLANFGLHLREY